VLSTLVVVPCHKGSSLSVNINIVISKIKDNNKHTWGRDIVVVEVVEMKVKFSNSFTESREHVDRGDTLRNKALAASLDISEDQRPTIRICSYLYW
jgi:hypothetical protein